MQLDALYAVLSVVREGEVRKRRPSSGSRAHPGCGRRSLPRSKLLLSIQVGARPVGMAPAGCPTSRSWGRPGWTALLRAGYSHALRHRDALRARGAAASAPGQRPGVQTPLAATARVALRAGGKPRGVWHAAAIEQGLAICGWQLNAAFVERLNLRASAFDLSC